MPLPTAGGQTNVIAGADYVSFQRGTVWTWRLQARSTQAVQIFSRKEKTNPQVSVSGSYTLDLDAGVGDINQLVLTGNTTLSLSSTRPGIYPTFIKPGPYTLSFGSGIEIQQTLPTPGGSGWICLELAKRV